MVGHYKKGQYTESASIRPDIYHILHRVTFRELLERYGWWGEGRLVGHYKKGQYSKSTSIQPDIYHILYRVTFGELFKGGGIIRAYKSKGVNHKT